MADPNSADAVFRIFINANIDRVWRELTKTGEAQGAVFNAWLHATGLVPGGRLQMRTATGKHVLVVGEVLEFEHGARGPSHPRHLEGDCRNRHAAVRHAAVAQRLLDARVRVAKRTRSEHWPL